MDWLAQTNTALQSFWVPWYKVTDLSKAKWQHHRKLVMLPLNTHMIHVSEQGTINKNQKIAEHFLKHFSL